MYGQHDVVEIQRLKPVIQNQTYGFGTVTFVSVFFIADKNAEKRIAVNIVNIMDANVTNQHIAGKKHDGKMISA